MFITYILKVILTSAFIVHISEQQACYLDSKGQCAGNCENSCAKCTATECLICNSGFTVNQTNNKTCIACTVPNCAYCNADVNKCSTCNPGYGKVNGNDTCAACKANCQLCGLDYTNCTHCTNPATYSLVNGDCILITTTVMTTIASTTIVLSSTATSLTQTATINSATINSATATRVSTATNIPWWIWLLICIANLVLLILVAACLYYIYLRNSSKKTGKVASSPQPVNAAKIVAPSSKSKQNLPQETVPNKSAENIEPKQPLTQPPLVLNPYQGMQQFNVNPANPTTQALPPPQRPPDLAHKGVWQPIKLMLNLKPTPTLQPQLKMPAYPPNLGMFQPPYLTDVYREANGSIPPPYYTPYFNEPPTRWMPRQIIPNYFN